jgi:hypothetical protein
VIGDRCGKSGRSDLKCSGCGRYDQSDMNGSGVKWYVVRIVKKSYKPFCTSHDSNLGKHLT